MALEFLGYVFVGLVVIALAAMLHAWWQKFVHNRPDRYGKGPGHDLRGPERNQWDRPPDI